MRWLYLFLVVTCLLSMIPRIHASSDADTNEDNALTDDESGMFCDPVTGDCVDHEDPNFLEDETDLLFDETQFDEDYIDEMDTEFDPYHLDDRVAAVSKLVQLAKRPQSITDLQMYLLMDKESSLEEAISLMYSFLNMSDDTDFSNPNETPNAPTFLDIPASKLLNNPNVEVISKYPGPRIFRYKNFVNEDELNQIFAKINASMHLFRPTGETGISLEAQIYNDEFWTKIADRMEDLIGFANIDKNGHSFRIRRYQNEQYHPIHTDSYSSIEGTLIGTQLIYLTTPEEGGETFFPNIGKDREILEKQGSAFPNMDYTKPLSDDMTYFKPVAGDLVMWFSCTPEGKDDTLSMHGSMPMIKGDKWTVANFVYQDRGFCRGHLEEPYKTQFEEAAKEKYAKEIEAFTAEHAPGKVKQGEASTEDKASDESC